MQTFARLIAKILKLLALAKALMQIILRLRVPMVKARIKQ